MSDETVCQETCSYVGIANLPNQVLRKYIKKGFEFTLMVVGESGLGKTTLMNSLFLINQPINQVVSQTVNIEISSYQIEENGIKLRLTIIDTPGFGDAMDNSYSLEPILQYINDQFEAFFTDENGLNRKNIKDRRVHCCLYFISPFGHGLKPLDIEFLKQLHNKVNIVPIIAKADCLTKYETLKLKMQVMKEIESNGIQIYSLLDCCYDEEEEYREQLTKMKEAVPFAVCGSNVLLEAMGRTVRGRLYPWGIIDIENPENCDFIHLRNMIITHLQDLQETTHYLHYENYRLEQLAESVLPTPLHNRTLSEHDKDKLLKEKEAEIRKMQKMLAKMQAKIPHQLL